MAEQTPGQNQQAAAEPQPQPQPQSDKPRWSWKKQKQENPQIVVEYPHRATAGSKPDVILNPDLKKFYKSTAWVCIPLTLAWLPFLGYWYGGRDCYTCFPNQPAAAANAPAVTPNQAPPSQATTKELAKDLAELQSLVEKLAESKTDARPAPASTATASATAAATTVQTQPPPTPPTPSTVILKVTNPLPVRVVEQPQPKPEVPAKPPKLTDAEERNEALFKRLRCKYHRVCD